MNAVLNEYFCPRSKIIVLVAGLVLIFSIFFIRNNVAQAKAADTIELASIKPLTNTSLDESGSLQKVSGGRAVDQSSDGNLTQNNLKDKRKLDAVEVREREGGLVPIFFRTYKKASIAISRVGSLFKDSVGHSTEWTAIAETLSHGNGLKFLFLCFLSFILMAIAGLTVEYFLRRWMQDTSKQLLASVQFDRFGRFGRIVFGILLEAIKIVAYVLSSFLLFVLIYRNEKQGYVLVAHCLLGSYYFRLIVLVAKMLLSPKGAALRILPMKDIDAVFLYRWIVRMALIATVIVVSSIIFREGGMSQTLFLMVYSVSGLSVGLAALVMIWQSRKRVGQAIRSGGVDRPKKKPLLHVKLAHNWHWFAMLYVIGITIFWQAGVVLEGKGRIIELFFGLFLIPVFIGLDHWGQRLLQIAAGELPGIIGLKSTDQSDRETNQNAAVDALAAAVEQKDQKTGIKYYLSFLQRSLRILLIAFLFFVVLRLWGIDFPLGRVFASRSLSIIVILLLGFLIWQFVKIKIDRKLKVKMPETSDEMEEGGAGGSRVATLLLLLRKFTLSVLFVIVSLIILSSIGVNIGPLIAGAGVVGLAIGFGAQTLVKDIISGVFFLIDDAFRVGDYIETAGTKGMVEHISLRSLRLRHPRGMVHTIPFGDMGTVTNFSRDYIITKLDIRVRYDANIRKIKKIVKKINEEIRQNEEFSRGLLDDIKSQGVREMDDSAMILRIKFKTIPGEQFVLRREIYRMIQEEFAANEIEFAHRNVTVYFPAEPKIMESDDQNHKKKLNPKMPDHKKKEAAAAAALRAIENGQMPKDRPDKS